MCARYTLYHPIGMVAKYFSAMMNGVPSASESDEPGGQQSGGGESLVAEDDPPHYNIAPTDRVVVVMQNGKRTLRRLRWGLTPPWKRSGSESSPPALVNARAETLLNKPMFRAAVRKHRCIVPASGFYEWRKSGKDRLPFYIKRRDGQPLPFAGLWEPASARDANHDTTGSCAIITVEANRLILPLHTRMPAILARAQEEAWLDSDGVDAEAAVSLLRPCPEDWLSVHPVSSRMNRVGVDDPNCILPSGHPMDDSLSLFGEES